MQFDGIWLPLKQPFGFFIPRNINCVPLPTPRPPLSTNTNLRINHYFDTSCVPQGGHFSLKAKTNLKATHHTCRYKSVVFWLYSYQERSSAYQLIFACRTFFRFVCNDKLVLCVNHYPVRHNFCLIIKKVCSILMIKHSPNEPALLTIQFSYKILKIVFALN